MGAIAMTGFFLLSGYSIALSSRNKSLNGRKQILTFYCKRAIAIFPLYYAYALLSFLPDLIKLNTSSLVKELILFPIESIGIQTTFSTLFIYSHNGGSWFISCILLCYLVFPLIKLLTEGMTDKTRVVCLMFLTAILLYSPFVVHFFKTNNIYDNPFFRILEFSIGVLVFQLNDSQSESKLKSLVRNPLICLLMGIVLITGISFAVHIGISGSFMLYSWIALPCFIVQLFSLGTMKIKMLDNNKTIGFLSAISFAFFLSQQLYMWRAVELFLQYTNVDTNFMRILCSFIVCLIGAVLLHLLIEKPSKKYFLNKLNKSSLYE